MSFERKRIVVTGAGKGIGRQIAIDLMLQGADVVGMTRSKEDLDEMHDEILQRQQSDTENKHYGKLIPVVIDLQNVEAIRAAMTIVRPMEVDMLVNNAGIALIASFLQTTVEDFDRVFAVNTRAAFVVSQEIARGMIKNGKRGSIVNVSSVASLHAIVDHTAYCTSKGALDQLTRCMALELGPHNIRVNSVNPHITETPMGKKVWCGDKVAPALLKIPMARFVQPEEVSKTIQFLLSSQSSMINGSIITVDGGHTCRR